MLAARDGTGKRKKFDDGWEGPDDPLADELSVWFMMRDEKVEFENPRNRWFMAGREVESYECY